MDDVRWNLLNGKKSTYGISVTQIQLKTPDLAQYVMIIGADLMTELGIDLLYSDQLMVWEKMKFL